MSISSEPELLQAFEQIARLQNGLASLTKEIPNASPRNLAMLMEGPLDQVAEIQAEIQEYLSLSRGEDFVGVRLVGPRIHLRETPVSVLTAVLDAFRKGVQAIAELKTTGERSTRPTAELKRLCDFQILALAPGSLRLLVRLPDEDPLIRAGENPASAALDDFLEVARWADSDRSAETLEKRFPDQKLRKAILSELQRVVPRPRGELELVEFSGPRVHGEGDRRSVRLVRVTRNRLNQAIDRFVEHRPETQVGVLREIDLDAKTFKLRQPGDASEVRCCFDDELLDAAKEALDKRVAATGLLKADTQRRGAAVLMVTRLEIVEEGESDTQ